MLYPKTNQQAYVNFWQTLNKLEINKPEIDFKKHLIYISDSEVFVREYGTEFDGKVVIVGSNPSRASWSLQAFEKGTKSRSTIDRWFEGEGKYHVVFMNVANFKKDDNKSLTKAEIQQNLPSISLHFKHMIRHGFKIVAVGKTAQTALDIADIPHFKMWHPSGLCRLWNDKKAGEAKIKEMFEWLKN